MDIGYLFTVYTEFCVVCGVWTVQLEQRGRGRIEIEINKSLVSRQIIISRVLRFGIVESVNYLGNSMLLKIRVKEKHYWSLDF